MYLISAYFDQESTRKIQKHIERIADVTNNRYMTEHQVPPHMTIASIEARSEEVLRSPFLAAADQINAGKISIVAVGMFLPYVVYAAPVLNEYLLDLSKKVDQQFADIPEVKMSKYYRPLHWMPHITLGKQLTNMQLNQAVEVLSQHFVPIQAQITSIGLSAVNPHRDIVRRDIKG